MILNRQKGTVVERDVFLFYAFLLANRDLSLKFRRHVNISPNMIPSGWLGSKDEPTNALKVVGGCGGGGGGGGVE